MDHLSATLRDLCQEAASVLEEECLAENSYTTAGAETRSATLFPHAALEAIVERVVTQEAVDVPGLLEKRQPGEERKEIAVPDGDTHKVVLTSGVCSLVARRNGLGPAHERNKLRERVPETVHCASEHMLRGLQILFAKALLGDTTDVNVRTRLVVEPREKLRREIDLLVAGSGKRPMPPEFVTPSFQAMPDVDFEFDEVTKARSAYLRALRQTEVVPVVMLPEVMTGDERMENYEPAKKLMRDGFRDAALKRLDAMVQDAYERRKQMMKSEGAEFGGLFAESLLAAREARLVRGDVTLQLSDPDPLQAEMRVRFLASNLVEAKKNKEMAEATQKQATGDSLYATESDVAGATRRYFEADALFAAALGTDLAEFYCHRSVVFSMQPPPPPPTLHRMSLGALMTLRFSIAVDVLTTSLSPPLR